MKSLDEIIEWQNARMTKRCPECDQPLYIKKNEEGLGVCVCDHKDDCKLWTKEDRKKYGYE